MSSTMIRSTRVIRRIALLMLSSAHQCAEFFDAEPGYGAAGVDGELTECLAEVRFPGPARAADAQVLVPVDPFQCPQGVLGGGRDGAALLVPDLEGLAGGEVRQPAARP